MENNTQHLYVNMPEHTPCFETIGAALASVPWDCEKEEGGKSFPAPVLSIPNVIIHIGPGVYREKLVVERPCLTLKGEGARREDVVLVYGEGAGEIMPDGNKRGTFRTASVRIDAHDFTAEHLTFRNDAGFGHTVGQALALYVDADRCYFNDCALIASQDTLFTAPLPPKEVEPGGFRGPGQTKPRILGRHCYRNCYIQGDIDFIFGGGICWFEDCVIFSKMPGIWNRAGRPTDTLPPPPHRRARSTDMCSRTVSWRATAPPIPSISEDPGENLPRPYIFTVRWAAISNRRAGMTGASPTAISITGNMIPTAPAPIRAPERISPIS